MRSVIRPLFAVLSAAALSSCIDTFSTAPGGRRSLAIVPRFSASATRASATLQQVGLEYNRVRIIIVRPGTPVETLKDTTIAFSPTSPEVTLELSIAALPAEALLASVEFKQNEQVIFSGEAEVKAVSLTSSSASTAIEVEVDYTGPGAEATTVAIQPGEGVYSSTTSTQFNAKGYDASNAEVPNTPMSWGVSDTALATISPSGLLTPKGTPGALEVTATAASGASKTIAVQLASAAVGLRVVQGAGQQGPPGSNLPVPVIVELFGTDGRPASGTGQAITFSASGSAQITPASTTIDANGRAQAIMKVGTTPGTTYIYTATSGGLSISWGGSATVGAPHHFVPSGPTTIRLRAGVVPDTIHTLRVADELENSVPGVLLKVTLSEGGIVRKTQGNIPADSIGLLEVYKVAPTEAGSYTVLVETEAPVSIPSITYTVIVEAGPAAKLAFTQQPPTSVVSGSSGAIKVSIQDRFGNLVTTTAPSNVNLAIDPAGDTGWRIDGTGSVAPVAGVAAFNISIHTTSGAKTGVRIQAVGANLPPVLSNAFNITLPP